MSEKQARKGILPLGLYTLNSAASMVVPNLA